MASHTKLFIVLNHKHCKAIVYHRDTYRYTGRGKTGFELHYNRKECKRKALANGYCWQHQYMGK